MILSVPDAELEEGVLWLWLRRKVEKGLHAEFWGDEVGIDVAGEAGNEAVLCAMNNKRGGHDG